MNEATRNNLEKNGWKVGDAKDFWRCETIVKEGIQKGMDLGYIEKLALESDSWRSIKKEIEEFTYLEDQ